jgi:hypothetical protein
MNDEPPEVESEEFEPQGDDPELAATRKLLASVEELRALLAPLTPSERERVLELARWLKEHPEET